MAVHAGGQQCICAGVSMVRRPATVVIVIAALALGFPAPSVVNAAVAVQPSAVASVGPWGTAQKVPGLAALGALSGEVTSVSCASAGNCTAGGDYGDGRYLKAFVLSEVNGTWSNALRVPGIAVLSEGRGQASSPSRARSPAIAQRLGPI